MAEPSPMKQVDAIVENLSDWRGSTLARLRSTILRVDPSIVEEVKWKKPSKPQGVPVWSFRGIICVADTLKAAVRLTFPHGAQYVDRTKLFNARLASASVRAVDFREADEIDESALGDLVRQAIQLNANKASKQNQ